MWDGLNDLQEREPMNLVNMTQGGPLLRRLRAVTAIVAALALSAIVVPAASADSTSASPPLPPVNSSLSSSSLTLPQWCESGKVLSRTLTPIISARRDFFDTGHPDLQMAVQVARPGRPPLLTAKAPFESGTEMRARYQVPEGLLQDGKYRFRVRAEDATTGVSAWLPWCAFTVYTGEVQKPGVPTMLLISQGPYSPFQSCDDPASVPVLSTRQLGQFAATPPSDNPNLVGRFEISRGAEEPRTELASLHLSADLRPGTLSEGDYRFRVRAEDGTAVSDWSVWCDFVVLP